MTSTRIGFLSNKLTLRGTEVAMYDYADFNETILNNKSIIISRDYYNISNQYDVSLDAYKKFHNRFTVEYYVTQSDIDAIVEKHKLTHLYIIKGGTFDGLFSTKCKNLVHCVFATNEPHGDVYSAISNDVNRLYNTSYPVVPHMIRNHDTTENLRQHLSIPTESVVFGRYGGGDTFDIQFVKDAVQNILNERDDVYFLFMNTNVFYQHARIIYLQGTTDMEQKKKFINTCDALLHAREGGETFGLVCGEFATELKPVITYSGSKERNHLAILGDKAILYHDYNSVYNILLHFRKGMYNIESNLYSDYTPQNIMQIFNDIFILQNTTKYTIYVNGFWGGFLNKTDANHIGFFEKIFPKTISFTNNVDSANVLFESVFSNSLIHAKNWIYKIQYSGEPKWNPIHDYDLTLYSEEDSDKILNLPLFVYYIHGNNLLDRLIHRPIRTTVPQKFCCFIVSNGNCAVRNKLFYMLNQYKRVDSYGKFENNTGNVLQYDYWTQDFLDFISNYKFIICFENSKFGTYSTEKIVNPYLANIIPIYWSSHQIKNTLNVESMLFLEDEREETYVDLINRVIELDRDDSKYLEYVNRPVFSQMDHWNNNYTIEALSRKTSDFFCKKTQKIPFNMKFFITHYTPLSERRDHIIKQMESAGITDYIFILSKDREALTPQELSKFSIITPPEISLFYKHVEIFNIAQENDIIVVFEDDAVLCDDFLKNMETCLSQLQTEQWDILFAGSCCNLHGNINPDKMVTRMNMSRGTCLYALNLGVGKRLYDLFTAQEHITCAIDWWFNHIEPVHDLKYYWSEPHLVSQGSDTGLFSSSLR